MAKVYHVDVGTKIRFNVGTDISSATVIEVHSLAPDGTEDEWTGTLYGTQYVDYVIPEALANGKWKFHVWVETPTGKWLGELAEMQVYSKWK